MAKWFRARDRRPFHAPALAATLLHPLFWVMLLGTGPKGMSGRFAGFGGARALEGLIHLLGIAATRRSLAAGLGLLAAAPARAARPATSIRTRDGVALLHRDWGSGPPVVFAASWSLPSDSWACQMLPLSEAGLRCVAHDRRGHGRSDEPGRGYDLDTLADDLAAVMEALDLRGATLVGFSIGCAEVVRDVARERAGHVARERAGRVAREPLARRGRAARAVPDASRTAERGAAGLRARRLTFQRPAVLP